MPSIKIMRRSLIGVILLVLLAVLFNYLQTWRRRNGPLKTTPQILGSEIVRSVEGLDYSDYRDGILHFKIHARKVLDNREKMSFLEGIEACDFNADGSTRNEIRSQYATYDRSRNIVDFSGDVRVFLGKEIELRTDSLHYDLNTSRGTTAETLQLYAQGASGTARGVRFDQKKGLLDLGSEVDFVLARRNVLSGTAGEPENLHATSERAHFSEMADRILFEGHAKIQSGSGSLSGDRIEIALEPGRKRVRSIHASGNACYESMDAAETQNLHGDRMDFDIDESGALRRIRVSEQAVFFSTSPSRKLDLQGGEIALEFDAVAGAVTGLQSRSGVRFRIENGATQTLISGDQLDLSFDPETRNVQSLLVSEHAGFSINGSGKSAGNELQANEIRISFLERDARAVLEKIRAKGSVRWRSAQRRNGSVTARGEDTVQEAFSLQEDWTLAASLLELLYSGDGDFLESGTASGDVVISQNSVDRNTPTQIRRLQADSARFGFFPGSNQPREMDAEGHVRIIYEKKQSPAGSSGSESFGTASEKMNAAFELKNAAPVLKSVVQSGQFRYQDAARSASAGRGVYDAIKELLVLEESPEISDDMGITTGKRVEYDQRRKELSVFGKVRSVLEASKSKGSSFFGSASSSSPVIVTAERLRYGSEEGHARYTTNVQLLSESQHLQTQTLEIFGNGDRVEAQGGVLHLISEAGASGDAAETGKSADSHKEPMRISSEALKYTRKDNTLTYSFNVHLESGDLELFSGRLDAVLDKEGKRVETAVARADETAAQGGRARERVLIRQGVRECKGETAYWYLEPGRFVVIGDPAEAFDPERGHSSARRLTYFTADDRILLESR